MKKINRNNPALALFFCIVCSFAELAAEPISEIINEPAQKKTRFAVLAVRAKDNTVLYSLNARTTMIPASNMKIITSAAALNYLKSDYVFKTQIALLDSDLVVIGAGDPLLADPVLAQRDYKKPDWVLDEIIAVLEENNIRSVNNIIIDNSFFDNNRVHPSWPVEQLNQWYACEIDGLNYNNNCVQIMARRTETGPNFQLVPQTNYITLINQARLVSKGSSVLGAYRNTKPNTLIIKGTLNQQTGFDVAVENPAAFFGYILYEKLADSKIRVNGKLVLQYVKNDARIKIIKTFSTPIADVLTRCNKNSLGLAAECLVKTISAENTQGRINGEWPHGLKLIERYLASLGVSDDQYRLDDGSGLSRNNRLSPGALVAVLQNIYKSPDWQMFEQTFAVGGVDGTTVKYFSSPPYKNNILGKTGYISGVRAFSGICKTPAGDILFSILTEGGDSSVRAAINRIAQALFDGEF